MFWPLRVADLVDIGLVAFLLYVLFWWLGRRMSRSALRGMGVVTGFVAGLYLLARVFEMYMVEQISQLLVVFILLATVVIFQSDFRRMVYSAGARLFGQDSKAEQTESSPVDLIVEAASHLANTSTGALIALRGRDPWDHYIQGGIELDGVASSPLLYGIFHPGTAGHDGAVLLEGRRVQAFAAHLPLANDLPDASRYGGTRHAAALGLSEVCDAFVIVVSEERGTISVAREGNIRSVETPAELKELLNRFWDEYYGGPSVTDANWWSGRALQTAALALGASVLLWFSIVYNPGTVYQTFDVPIEYHDVPADWALEDGASTARITLSGPEQAFRLVDPDELSVVFSLASPEEGVNELTVTERTLDLPGQLALAGAAPQRVTVRAMPLERMRVPVSVRTKGQLPDSLELAGLNGNPDSVTVLVPEGQRAGAIETEPLVLDSIRTDTTVDRPLVLFEGARFPEASSRAVRVRVRVRPRGEPGKKSF